MRLSVELKAPFSIQLELEDGGIVTYENVRSYTIEEDVDVEIELESPDLTEDEEGEDIDDTEEEGEAERREDEIPLEEVDEKA